MEESHLCPPTLLKWSENCSDAVPGIKIYIFNFIQRGIHYLIWVWLVLHSSHDKNNFKKPRTRLLYSVEKPAGVDQGAKPEGIGTKQALPASQILGLPISGFWPVCMAVGRFPTPSWSLSESQSFP